MLTNLVLFTALSLFSSQLIAKEAPDRKIPVNAFVNTSSGWEVLDVEKRMEKAFNFFSEKCQVELFLEGVRFEKITGMERWEFLLENHKLTSKKPNFNGIFLIFTNSPYVSIGDQIMDFGQTGVAFRQSSNWIHMFQLNSALFFKHDLDLYESTPGYKADVLVHEIAHLLINENHNDRAGNILSGDYDGMDIETQQCQDIREYWGL